MLRTIEEEIRRLELVVSPRQQYRQSRPQRTLLCMECPEGASFAELDLMLKRYILSPQFDSYRTYRFGEIFDGTALQKGEVRLIGIYTDLASPPDFPDRHILVRPAGEYLCFQCKFFAEQPELSAFRPYLSQAPISKVFADELNYSTDYSEIISEVQISV